ncbi:NADP-dependent phosphogluconate dehydrogenase [Aureisphaera galaxeae]|uniref:NADP-dependent phosphogluconate dehydrogenase n=1 Tax=Aureisphaera galaxeae TaxID=1538023 RepID=UPI00234FD7E2|nr:NADP-dependent phosphogluconate dehydrogenase [Aureisphaera galaxeae]MDC8004230.1 NADP-dependent phosphogluconate dehydrogenase [Aureisphaera galaxeae]
MLKSDIGIIGLGVMGRSLAKNMLSKDFSVSAYNRWTEAEKDIVPNFLKDASDNAQGFTNLSKFVNSLQSPRKIILMVTAGAAVDAVVSELKPLLDSGDIIADGGNSHFKDTQRRVQELKENDIEFLGVGVSGGEQGALHGPCIMPGGKQEAYLQFQPILEAIAAKDNDGKPCVSWIGPDGSGHLVKTVHNGIEYAEMQLIADCYAILSPTHSNEEIAAIFIKWNKGDHKSYLLGITATILQKKEGDDYLIDKVLDKAGNKGTGSWTSQLAFQLGIPTPTINAAVTARYLSSKKEERMKLSKAIPGHAIDEVPSLEALAATYRACRILNHHQGFEVIRAASDAHNWNINLSELARIWTEGCIIKSQLMESFVDVFKNHTSILDDRTILRTILKSEKPFLYTLIYSLKYRLLNSCISESYNYYAFITTAQSSAHIIQAQRDEFGAHTYRRNDRPENESFTTNWTNNG